MLDATLLLGCLTLGMDPALALSIVDELSAREPTAVVVSGPEIERLVPVTASEAAALAAGLVARGEPTRIGLMGVDAAGLDGPGLRDAFDPCANLALGERRYLDALDAATAAGLAGDPAEAAALASYLAGAGDVDALVRAVRSRRGTSERWLAAHRPSTVAVAPRRDGAAPSGTVVRRRASGSSTVAWTPRRGESSAVAPNGEPEVATEGGR